MFKKLAKLKYLPNKFEIIKEGDHVICSISGKKIGLLYQKYLLSESADAKVEYLFLLDELFVKDKLQNVYSIFLSENLKKIGLENLSYWNVDLQEAYFSYKEASKAVEKK